MKRTLLTVGNSVAVTLPREALERFGLSAGDAVELEIGEESITVRPERSPVDAEFERAFRKVFTRYRETLRRLAEYDREGERA